MEGVWKRYLKLPENLINDYYSKSCDMSMSYFCRINKIKVYLNFLKFYYSK